MSPRTEVRAAFAAALTGLTATGDRVFLARTRPVEATELPAILVFSGEASHVATTMSGKAVAWRYQIRVDILVKERTGAEQAADQILDEINAALFSAPGAQTLGGKVRTLQLIGIGEPDLDDSTDKPTLRVPVLYEATY